jgi:hypothetical protein
MVGTIGKWLSVQEYILYVLIYSCGKGQRGQRTNLELVFIKTVIKNTQSFAYKINSN